MDRETSMWGRRLWVWAALATGLLGAAPSVAVAQNRTWGIDISSWQGANVNWPNMRSHGFEFAFIRATRGGTTSLSVTDQFFASNTTRARAAGLRTGAYHFARFDGWTYGDWTGPNSPRDEARHFLSVAGPFIGPGSLPPVLDLEDDSSLYVNGTLPAGVGSNKFTPAQLTEWAMRFCEEIMAAKGPEARPIIYVNGHYAGREITRDLTTYPLWLARYGSVGDPRTTGEPAVVGSLNPITGVWGTQPLMHHDTWAFWQYSNSYTFPTGFVSGIPNNGPVDLNVFNNAKYGSLDAFTIRGAIPEPSMVSLLVLPGLALLRRR